MKSSLIYHNIIHDTVYNCSSPISIKIEEDEKQISVIFQSVKFTCYGYIYDDYSKYIAIIEKYSNLNYDLDSIASNLEVNYKTVEKGIKQQLRNYNIPLYVILNDIYYNKQYDGI